MNIHSYSIGLALSINLSRQVEVSLFTLAKGCCFLSLDLKHSKFQKSPLKTYKP